MQYEFLKLHSPFFKKIFESDSLWYVLGIDKFGLECSTGVAWLDMAEVWVWAKKLLVSEDLRESEDKDESTGWRVGLKSSEFDKDGLILGFSIVEVLIWDKSSREPFGKYDSCTGKFSEDLKNSGEFFDSEDKLLNWLVLEFKNWAGVLSKVEKETELCVCSIDLLIKVWEKAESSEDISKLFAFIYKAGVHIKNMNMRGKNSKQREPTLTVCDFGS